MGFDEKTMATSFMSLIVSHLMRSIRNGGESGLWPFPQKAAIEITTKVAKNTKNSH